MAQVKIYNDNHPITFILLDRLPSFHYKHFDVNNKIENRETKRSFFGSIFQRAQQGLSQQ